MRVKNQGFSLIELMVVIAVIGILAAVAVPLYRDYTLRAKTAEARSLIDGFMHQLAEVYELTGRFNGRTLTMNGVTIPTNNVMTLTNADPIMHATVWGTRTNVGTMQATAVAFFTVAGLDGVSETYVEPTTISTGTGNRIGVYIYVMDDIIYKVCGDSSSPELFLPESFLRSLGCTCFPASMQNLANSGQTC